MPPCLVLFFDLKFGSIVDLSGIGDSCWRDYRAVLLSKNKPPRRDLTKKKKPSFHLRSSPLSRTVFPIRLIERHARFLCLARPFPRFHPSQSCPCLPLPCFLFSLFHLVDSFSLSIHSIPFLLLPPFPLPGPFQTLLLLSFDESLIQLTHSPPSSSFFDCLLGLPPFFVS